MACTLSWNDIPKELIINILKFHVEPSFREIDARTNQLILSFIYPDILRDLFNDLDQHPMRDSIADKHIYALLSPINAEGSVPSGGELAQEGSASSSINENPDPNNPISKKEFYERLSDPDFVCSRIEAVFKELMHRSEEISDPKARIECQTALEGMHCSAALQAMSHFENQSLITFVEALSNQFGSAFKNRVIDVLKQAQGLPNKTEFTAHQFRRLLEEFQPELNTIQYLDLSHCKLTSVPPEIGMLKELVILNLSHNKLTQLPAEIGGLKSLTRLILSNNLITQVPNEISQLAKLSELYLDSNKLDKVPAGILALNSLEILNLSSNQLVELPEAISQMNKLKEFHIANNKILSFPDLFGNLLALKRIDARNNCIETLPRSFQDLKRLEVLNLTKNKLSRFPCPVKSLPRLTDLKLDPRFLLKKSSFKEFSNSCAQRANKKPSHNK